MIEKIEKPITPLELNNKVNEIIDNLGMREVGEFVRGFWSANHVPKNLLYCDGTEFSGAEGEMFHELYTKKLLGEITQDAVVETTFKATNGIFQGSSSFLMFVRVPLTASSVPYGDLLLNFTTGDDVITEQFVYECFGDNTIHEITINNGYFLDRQAEIIEAKPNTTYTLKITSDLQVSIIENGVETAVCTASSFSTTYCWFFGNASASDISGFLGTINLLASTYTNELGVSVPLAKMQSDLDICSYAEYETELTMTGSCWKWAVDTANEKFRIPFIPDKVLVDIDDTVGVRGNGNALGLQSNNGVENTYLGIHNISNNSVRHFLISGIASSAEAGSKLTYTTALGDNDTTLGIATDPTNSGIIADTANAKTYKTIRHFVVVATGSIEQTNADWTNFANGLASKANNDLSNVTQSSGLRRLIEVSDSGLMPSWYKVFEETNPATGEIKKWCEQGWTNTGGGLSGAQTVVFLKEFADTNYCIFKTRGSSSSDITSARAESFYNKTTTTADTYLLDVDSSWLAMGYVKE